MQTAAKARMIPPGIKTDLNAALAQSVMDFNIILCGGKGTVSSWVGSQMDLFHSWNGATLRAFGNPCIRAWAE